jgi:GntR family transcriptional repressor for pyruvate dehydrogenase complex
VDEIFSRIEHSRTSDEVVHQIEGLILEGIFRAGDRLPGERDLSRRFDVSRPILRDALKTLESRGLLVSRHGGGTHVADIIGEVFTKPVRDLVATHKKAARDFLEYRREVESIAADYAARRATDDDRVMLAGIVARMKDAHARADFQEEAALDVELHSAIGECAHNVILLHTLRSCYRLLADDVFVNRMLIYGLPGARDDLLAQHQSIAQAVLAGDSARARTAVRAHIDYVERVKDEAERSDAWQKVSRLRLMQRTGTETKKSVGSTH